MTYQYRQTLPSTPLDIIGDVHGELEALRQLLHHLGYTETGSHPKGRKLVFAGDLCDRGPDSPGVLAWFKQAHDAGHAFTVLGNHELNAFMHEPKDGSGWIFPERQTKDAVLYAPWNIMPEAEKTELYRWLAEQPLILERPDIRIVHAAWLPQHFPILEDARGESLQTQYVRFDRELNQALEAADWYPDYRWEQIHLLERMENPDLPPPPMPATAQYEYCRSIMHPIRSLTGGIEQLDSKPFYAGGRWRYTRRCAWWRGYQDKTPVIFGHYWRSWYHKREGIANGTALFPEAGNRWVGANQTAFCIDFSVGARWRDRKNGILSQKSAFRLAALRWPERVLVFDNGDVEKTETA